MAPGEDPISGGESAPPPESEADRAFRVERDAEENRDSDLPEDEEIRIVSFTVSEVYTPSTIDGLVDGVQALGWVRDEKFNPPFTNLIDWIGQSRSAPFGGGWVNLSYISDTTGQRPLGGGLQASMPAGVQEIWGQAHSVTPALTALVLQFVLDERTSKSLNPLFAEERVTRVERMGSGWAYIGPANQRTELVVAERRRIRAACHGWIRDHVPGSFSAAGSDMDLPTIETFVCDETKPFESIDRGARTDYRMVLNIDADIDAFESPQLPGWRLAMWDFRSFDGPFTIRLGGRWRDVSNDLAPYGGANNSGLANRLMHPLADFAARFAVHSLLSTFERHLAGIRDRVAQAGNHRNRVRDDDIAELYDLVTDAGYDARVVAAELADFCGDPRRYGHAEVDFAPVADWRREHEPSLLEVLRSADEARAANVMAAEAIARDSVANLASVMTSKVNLRLGRIVHWLTWVAVATGILALAVSVVALRVSS